MAAALAGLVLSGCTSTGPTPDPDTDGATTAATALAAALSQKDLKPLAFSGATGAAVDEQFLSYEQVEHELKTPLTSIRSLSEILLDCPDLSDDERGRFLRILLEENERLTRVVDRLLGAPAMRKVLS